MAVFQLRKTDPYLPVGLWGPTEQKWGSVRSPFRVTQGTPGFLEEENALSRKDGTEELLSQA